MFQRGRSGILCIKARSNSEGICYRGTKIKRSKKRYGIDIFMTKPILKYNKYFTKEDNRIEQLLNAGDISEYTKCTILDMSDKVLKHIARKYVNVREGVKDVMGGRVLDYEAKRIKNEGVREGRAEGIVETGIDFGLSDNEILEKLQIKLNISLQMAQEYFLKYGKKTV